MKDWEMSTGGHVTDWSKMSGDLMKQLEAAVNEKSDLEHKLCGVQRSLFEARLELEKMRAALEAALGPAEPVAFIEKADLQRLKDGESIIFYASDREKIGIALYAVLKSDTGEKPTEAASPSAEGWQWVPKEMTEAMSYAGRMARMNIEGGYGGPGVWEAILAAAPQPKGSDKP